jgi:hypothetical protein
MSSQIPAPIMQMLMQMYSGSVKDQKVGSTQVNNVQDLIKLLLDPATGQLSGTDFGSSPSQIPYADQLSGVSGVANNPNESQAMREVAQGLLDGGMTPSMARQHIEAAAVKDGSLAWAEPKTDAAGKVNDDNLQSLFDQAASWSKEISDNTAARDKWNGEAASDPTKHGAPMDIWQQAGLPGASDQYDMGNLPVDAQTDRLRGSLNAKAVNDRKAFEDFVASHKAPVNPGGRMVTGDTQFPARAKLTPDAPAGEQSLLSVVGHGISDPFTSWGNALGGDLGELFGGDSADTKATKKQDKMLAERNKQNALFDKYMKDKAVYDSVTMNQQHALAQASGRSTQDAAYQNAILKGMLNHAQKTGRTPLGDALKARLAGLG